MAKTNENSQTNVKEMKKGFNKAFAEHRIAYIIVYIIFTLYAITLLYPLLWVFVQSFRTKFVSFGIRWNFPSLSMWKIILTSSRNIIWRSCLRTALFCP